MIVLGVDPGTLITGFGVIESQGMKVNVLHYDIVRNRSNRSMPLRLKSIYEALCRVIEQYHPDEFAIETAFYGKNAQSALKIGHARGVAILAAVNYEIPTTEYSPREVKKAIVGNGAASKEQVQAMVKSLLSLKTTPKFFDATDALAVALCHFHRGSRRNPVKSKRSRPKKNSNGWAEFIAAHPERVVNS
jgi:crossover junction endodeoxyribonuclease RuvC